MLSGRVSREEANGELLSTRITPRKIYNDKCMKFSNFRAQEGPSYTIGCFYLLSSTRYAIVIGEVFRKGETYFTLCILNGNHIALRDIISNSGKLLTWSTIGRKLDSYARYDLTYERTVEATGWDQKLEISVNANVLCIHLLERQERLVEIDPFRALFPSLLMYIPARQIGSIYKKVV